MSNEIIITKDFVFLHHYVLVSVYYMYEIIISLILFCDIMNNYMQTKKINRLTTNGIYFFYSVPKLHLNAIADARWRRVQTFGTDLLQKSSNDEPRSGMQSWNADVQ